WRYWLTGVRSAATPGRFRGERLRSAATRRHTLGTGAVLRTAYLEKSGCFTVKIRNKWPVFQCTVNWARARHRSTFIAGGAAGSSSFCAAGVRKCVATDVENSVLQSNSDVSHELIVDRALHDAGCVVLESFLKSESVMRRYYAELCVGVFSLHIRAVGLLAVRGDELPTTIF
ncbi:hypothetical protein, partial [Gimesia sp.]|uniref:hypothetical protein n=1 Tax=Gimesia sp. TaxID=2024833 RepID=UPI003A925997